MEDMVNDNAFVTFPAGDGKWSILSNSSFEKWRATRCCCKVDWYVHPWCRKDLIEFEKLHVPSNSETQLNGFLGMIEFIFGLSLIFSYFCRDLPDVDFSKLAVEIYKIEEKSLQ